MLVIIVILAFGIKYRNKAYWLRAILIPIHLQLVNLLFSARGSLGQPELDGIITKFIRSTYGDGPMFGIYAIFIIVIAWGPAIWLFRLAIRNGKVSRHKNLNHQTNDTENVSLTSD